MSVEGSMKVLLVEDHPGDARLIVEMLRSQSEYSFDLQHVSSIDRALSEIHSRNFDAILLDLNLPDTMGIESVAQLRAEAHDIPIVVMSGIADDQLALEAINYGVQDYLIKGEFDEPQLIRTIRFSIKRKQATGDINRLAHHDHLTGLANRVLFQDRLEQSMARTERNGTSTALLFIDLDKFKVVNDQFGHEVGDQVLGAVSRLISGCVRNCDTVARMGGDEFAIVLDEVKSSAVVARIAEKIVSALSRRMKVQGKEVRIGASIGVAFFPECSGIKELLKAADEAMYRAKRAGGNRYKLYTDNMSQEALWKYELDLELPNALKLQEFVVFYQPLVDLETGKLAGLEALLRWQHPKAGLIMPDAFIDNLEASQLCWDVGEWVIEFACRQLKSWQRLGLPPISMDINISPYQLTDPDFFQRVWNILQETGVEPACLELEITERQHINENDQVSLKNIKNLVKSGVKLALDDYGTGNNSDDYLRRYPFQTMKIDRSYIMNIVDNHTDLAMVKRDVEFAHNLGMRVIAEGIETHDQLEIVQKLGVDIIQGYLIGKPMIAPRVADGIWRGDFNLDKVMSSQTEHVYG